MLAALSDKNQLLLRLHSPCFFLLCPGFSLPDFSAPSSSPSGGIESAAWGAAETEALFPGMPFWAPREPLFTPLIPPLLSRAIWALVKGLEKV